MAAQAEQAMRPCCMGILHEVWHKDLVVNICAHCLWSHRYRNNGFSVLTKCVGSREFITHQYLYRVLRTIEDPLKGLNAKNKFALESVKRHLSSGNYHGYMYTSQYISTFTSLESADRFAKKGIRYVDSVPKQIVQIKVSQLDTATFIDFSNYGVYDVLIRNQGYSFNTHMDFNFASIPEEVLVVGQIPECAITAIYYSDWRGLTCTCLKILMLETNISDIRLVVNICANCLKNFWMRENLSPPYQLSRHVSVCESLMCVHRFLYRVLRESESEDTSYYLKAKNELGIESVKRHVATGSTPNYESQYISTFTTIEQAIWFADIGIRHGDPLPKRIVKIDVSLLPRNTFIDFSKQETCDALLGNSPDEMSKKAYKFANSFKVSVVGRIPAGAIIAKYKKSSVMSGLQPYN